MKSLRLVCLALMLTPIPQQLRIHLQPTGGSGGGATIQQSDLSLLGYFTMPSSPTPMSGTGDPEIMMFRKVGGVVHPMLVQNQNHGNGSAGFSSLYEYADPGTYGTVSSPTHGTFVKNWGLDSPGGSPYDMWHGLPGKSICLSTTPWSETAGSCVAGSAVNIGEVSGSGVSNWVAAGAYWHDDSSGHCCAFLTYAQGYSNYSPDYNVIMADLVTQGGVNAYGPFRTCAGTYGPGGTNGEVCGGQRGFWLWDAPDGSMGISGGTGEWQQSTDNKGPSIHWGAPWITSATAQGYGSTRGSVAYRTTDIPETTQALALYSLDLNINCDGSIASGPNISMRRPTDPTLGNYFYENASSACDAEQIDPSLYGGVGSWTSVDRLNGATWINTSPKSGVVFPATLSTGHTWYRTAAGYTYQEKGVGPTLIFQRNVEEALACSLYADENADLRFAVKPAFYTNIVANAVSINLLNPGTPNASASVTHSGNAVTVHLATNGSSQVTTTAANVITRIAGDGFANTVFSVTLPTYPTCGTPFGGSNDGSAAVNTITNATLDSGATAPGLSSGVLTPGAGPLFCPLHNFGPVQNNTGPISSDYEPALIVYSTAAVTAAPTSGNPEYSLDPDSIIYLHNIDPTIPVNSAGPTFENQLGGSYFDSVSKKLYVNLPFTDTSTIFSFNLPLIAVFSVNTAMPAPTPLDLLFSWLRDLTPHLTQRLTTIPSLFQAPHVPK